MSSEDNQNSETSETSRFEQNATILFTDNEKPIHTDKRIYKNIKQN